MRKGVRRALVATAVAIVVAAAVVIGCTLDVGQPNITIDCVEVLIDNTRVLYCDGKLVPTAPPPHDAGHDG